MTLFTKVGRYRSRATDSGGLGYASFILLLLIVAYWFVQPHVFGSGAQLDSFISEGVVVALAAMGTAVVIITGEFDLSVGSALTLVNVVVVTQVGESIFSQASVVVLALMTGVLVGGLNGVLIAYLKIPSIVATLATLFLWSGVALLILHQPGGRMPDRYVLWFTGYSGLLPTAVVIVGGAVLGWLIIARSILGRRIFAVGGNAEAAHANGININRTKLLAFVIAGAFYGLSGAVLTAQSTSGDPNIGDTLVLTVYAALVVGGMPLGGGRGSALSGVVGALTLVVLSRILFAFGVSSFYTSILQGTVLIAAVAIPLLRPSTIADMTLRIGTRFTRAADGNST